MINQETTGALALHEWRLKIPNIGIVFSSETKEGKSEMRTRS